MTQLTAVILCGGRGTRISHLFPDCPKPMVEVAGQPFLHWVVRWLEAQGVRALVLSTGYLGEQIESWAKSQLGNSTKSVACRREVTPLGTAGAIRNCLDLCSDPFWVLNGDSLAGVNLADALQRFDAANPAGVLFGLRQADASRFGALDIEESRLIGFREKGTPGPGFINAGVYLFRRALFERMAPERAASLETELLPQALAVGERFEVVPADVPFIDIGTPESVAQASRFVARHPELFGAG